MRGQWLQLRHQNPPWFRGLLVNVTQPLVPSVYQLKDRIIVHDAICRDRRRKLWEGWLTEGALVRGLLTVT